MATRGGWRKPWPTVQMEIHRSRRYYVKLFALSFVLGGLFESLLIATGYYKNNIKTAEDLEKALEKKKHKREFGQHLQTLAGEKLAELRG